MQPRGRFGEVAEALPNPETPKNPVEEEINLAPFVDPSPPVDVPRPHYIPRELHSQAGCVEIMYPDAGVARVWRVPK